VKSSDDPFNNYGFGIIAYFKLLNYLMYAYLLIGAMAVLLMYIYAKGGTLDNERNGYLAKYTLGNLGQSQADCIN